MRQAAYLLQLTGSARVEQQPQRLFRQCGLVGGDADRRGAARKPGDQIEIGGIHAPPLLVPGMRHLIGPFSLDDAQPGGAVAKPRAIGKAAPPAPRQHTAGLRESGQKPLDNLQRAVGIAGGMGIEDQRQALGLRSLRQRETGLMAKIERRHLDREMRSRLFLVQPGQHPFISGNDLFGGDSAHIEKADRRRPSLTLQPFAPASESGRIWSREQASGPVRQLISRIAQAAPKDRFLHDRLQGRRWRSQTAPSVISATAPRRLKG